MRLTDLQWNLLETLFEKPVLGGKGRPPRDPREVLDGILWILKTGARWQDLPPRYPPYQTCHRRFQAWARDGTLEQVLRTLAKDLKERGGIDVREAFIDGSFASAKKGAFVWGRPSAARAPSSWWLPTATVFLSPYALKVLRRTK